MRPIGGFLDFEIGRSRGPAYHTTLALNSGRACLAYIIDNARPSKIFLPYYSCDALLTPVLDRNIEYEYYALNESLEIAELPACLDSRDMLLYVNYFGLKDDYACELATKFGDGLIVDDTQAFFRRGYESCWSFNSVRKFFGVPDGGYVYCPAGCSSHDLEPEQADYAYLVKRMLSEDGAYAAYLEHESVVSCQIRRISDFSAHILRCIDYDSVAKIRRRNFFQLHDALVGHNEIDFTIGPQQVPLYYPFLSARLNRERLLSSGINIPRLWPEIESREALEYVFERRLSICMSALPVDQRYGPTEMSQVVTKVRENLN